MRTSDFGILVYVGNSNKEIPDYANFIDIFLRGCVFPLAFVLVVNATVNPNIILIFEIKMHAIIELLRLSYGTLFAFHV